MNTNRRHAVAALIAAGLLWGTTVPLSKLALEWLSPGWLTVVRFGLAAAVLLAAVLRTTGRPALRAAFTPGVLVAGAFGYGGSVIVQNAGIMRTSVTHAALLIGAVPVLVAVIAAVWHRAVARPVAWFGFAVSLGGVGLVTAGGGGGGATMAGDGLVLVSLLLSATVTVAQGRLLTGRDPVAVTAVQFLGATLGALPVAVLTEGGPTAPGGASPVLAVVALAVAGTLLPFTLFAFGQSRVSAEVAGAFLNLEPLVGAIAGAVAFADPVGLAQVAGGMAILTGIGLSSLPLLAGRRASRRTVAVPAAGAGAGAGVGAGAALEGARAQGHGCGNVMERVTTLPHPWNPGGPQRERYGVFAGVYAGKFGADRAGGTRPGPGPAGRGLAGGPRALAGRGLAGRGLAGRGLAGRGLAGRGGRGLAGRGRGAGGETGARDRRGCGPAGGWRDGHPPAGGPGAGTGGGRTAAGEDRAGGRYRRCGASSVMSAGDRRSRAVLAWCQYG